jgi:nanoRNase/pAp phosphatase (c-di-AMP/oligoRNAs hydrolase)
MNMVSYGTLDDILADREVRDRVHFLKEEQSRYIETLSRCSRADQNVIITDVRDLDYVPNGDKFLVYTLFPDQNVSLNVFNKRKTDLTVISGGYSIFNRTCEAHIGELMQRYGGGGHRAAGSCRVRKDESESVLSEIVEHLKTGVN